MTDNCYLCKVDIMPIVDGTAVPNLIHVEALYDSKGANEMLFPWETDIGSYAKGKALIPQHPKGDHSETRNINVEVSGVKANKAVLSFSNLSAERAKEISDKFK